MSLGDRIRSQREKKGWGVREFAGIAGVRYAMVSELENNKRDDATGKNLARMAKTLGVSIDYLVGLYEPDEGIDT